MWTPNSQLPTPNFLFPVIASLPRVARWRFVAITMGPRSDTPVLAPIVTRDGISTRPFDPAAQRERHAR